MDIVFASNNIHKIKELQFLMPASINLLSLKEIGCNESLEETSNTIEGNAYQKASYVAKNYHCNCFADDTGLEVFSLNGEPGVYSARYAGINSSDEENISKLLTSLNNSLNREARFKTVIALVVNENIKYFEGIIKGNIGLEPNGSNGFGYDSIFIPEGYDLTFAQMESSKKNEISHRAIAVKKLVNFLNLTKS